MSVTAERGISHCWQNNGFDVYSAGPCFNSIEEAVDYRERLDYAGTTWVSQDDPMPRTPPAGWINPKNSEVHA